MIGNQLPQPDPRGWLVFDHLDDDLQRAEDSTAAADFVRSAGHRYLRPATTTEIALLTHLGYDAPEGLQTEVSYPTGAVRRRRWPTLEITND